MPHSHTRRWTTLLATVLAGLMLVPATATADSWRDDEYWIEDYGFDKAWEKTKGEGITVAIIDTGIDASHPDLTDAVAGGTDPSGQGKDDGTKPLGPDPVHGTSVASLLAGHGNNAAAIKKAKKANDDLDDDETPKPVPDPGPGSDGVIGTAPEAELLSVSVHLGDDAERDVDEQIAEGVKWAVDHGADVINISLASSEPQWPESWDEAFKYAEDHDVVIVAAAGNRASGSESVGAPATIPGVLTVGGLEEDGTASWDSSTEGITIGVSAAADPLVGAIPGGEYQEWSGTSGAAPIVSGLVALIRAEYPDATAAEVINHVLETATPIEGDSSLYGHGMINAQKALDTDVASVNENPMGSLEEWIKLHRRGDAESQPVREHHPEHTQVEVPTELPQAAEQTDNRTWIPPVTLGVIALGTLVFVVLGLRASRNVRRKS